MVYLWKKCNNYYIFLNALFFLFSLTLFILKSTHNKVLIMWKKPYETY